MPTYHYKCFNCGKELEIFQNMKDDPLKNCPGCLLSTLDRLIFPSTFILSGKGWFKDGYSNSSK